MKEPRARNQDVAEIVGQKQLYGPSGVPGVDWSRIRQSLVGVRSEEISTDDSNSLPGFFPLIDDTVETLSSWLGGAQAFQPPE